MSVGERLISAVDRHTARQMAKLPTVKVGEVIRQTGSTMTVQIGTVTYSNVTLATPISGLVSGMAGKRVLCHVGSGDPVVIGFIDSVKDPKVLRSQLWMTM